MSPPYPSKEGYKARMDLIQGKVPTFVTVVPRSANFTRAARSRRLAWDLPRGNPLRLLFDELKREVLTYADQEA